jgi:two-component system, NtrC family, sensor kinase
MNRRSGKKSAKSRKTQSRKSGVRKTRKTTKPSADHSASATGLEWEIARLTRELEEGAEEQSATAAVLEALNRSAFDLDSILQMMVGTAARLCKTGPAVIFLREGDVYKYWTGQSITDAYREHEKMAAIRPGRGTVVGRVAMTGSVVQIADALSDPEYEDKAAARADNLRTMLGVPLLRNGQPVGVFSLARNYVEPFTDSQIRLVSTFANQAVLALESARLFNEAQSRTLELQESLQQQTATADVLKVISRSTFDLQTVLETLTESAAHLCNADMAAIARKDERGFYHATNYNFTVDWVRVADVYRLQPGRGSVVGRALLARKAVQIVDVLADPEYAFPDMQKAAGYRSLLGVPMMRGTEPIGALFLGRTIVQPFTDKQIELVSTFADQAVIAIENARLFDEVQSRTRDLTESLQQQTATAEVLKVISRSTFDLPAVLQALVETAAELCDADKGTITRQRDGEFYRAESYGFSEDFMNFVRGVPVVVDRHSATGRALLEGIVVHIPDVETDRDYTFREGQRLGEFRSLLGVPMLREGVPMGVITLTRTEPRPFTDKQIELAITFADQAAIAIHNVRLFDELQTRTRELTRSLEDLRTAQDRLVQTEKLASLGQLTAGIAHEIKNPLNFVNNFAALSAELVDEMNGALEEAGLDKKKREGLDEIRELLKSNLEKVVQHGKRADTIVKNMLLHSRSGSVDHRAVEINTIVDESLSLAYHGARAERPGFNITLERDFGPGVGVADVYPQEITRVFLNLISNGFYAATRRVAEAGNGFEPRLKAITRDLGDKVEIRIRDNGEGISPEVRDRIFTPFFTTKPTGEGTGLGLSISHDIVVKQHGGTIEVATEPGAFTEFIVTLPRTLPARAEAERTTSSSV